MPTRGVQHFAEDWRQAEEDALHRIWSAESSRRADARLLAPSAQVRLRALRNPRPHAGGPRGPGDRLTAANRPASASGTAEGDVSVPLLTVSVVPFPEHVFETSEALITTTAPPTNKGRRFAPEPLTRAETARLLAAVPTRSTSGVRLRALIAVLYGAGLRVQEALDLMPRDVDPQACTIRVRNGKGGKTMTVSIDPASCELLGRWMDRRAGLGLTGRHPVFAAYSVGHVGAPIDQRAVRAALARFGEKAGVEKRVHPHGLRHSLAFQLYLDGVPLNEIRRQLRHSSLAGTQHYIDHLCPSTDLAAVMAARPDWTQQLKELL